VLCLMSSIHVPKGLPFLLLPSVSHSITVFGSQSFSFLFTCPHHCTCFYSIVSRMFFSTSIISLITVFLILSLLDFLADRFQQSISVASNLVCCLLLSVHVSDPCSKILSTIDL
jgi:hypothetical protein